jgi:hypothetical protein
MTVETGAPMGVNAQSLKFVSESGIIIRLIETHERSCLARQTINQLIIL